MPSVNFTNAVIIQDIWPATATSSLINKSLALQYEEETDKYTIFALDGDIAYTTVIYKSTVPPVFLTDQVSNDLYKFDFETNFKSGSNQQIPSSTGSLPTASYVGQTLYALDGVTLTPQLPLTSLGGWLLNDPGILLVVG